MLDLELTLSDKVILLILNIYIERTALVFNKKTIKL
jgi:hypothetical protein